MSDFIEFISHNAHWAWLIVGLTFSAAYYSEKVHGTSEVGDMEPNPIKRWGSTVAILGFLSLLVLVYAHHDRYHQEPIARIVSALQ